MAAPSNKIWVGLTPALRRAPKVRAVGRGHGRFLGLNFLPLLFSTVTHGICTKPTKRKLRVSPILPHRCGHRSSDVIAECPSQFSVDCVMIRSAALIKHRLVTNRQTDRQTADPSIPRAMPVRCICVTQ